MDSDRELLFGVMAVQLGFVDAAAVVAAGAEWAARRGEGLRLGELLQRRDRLTKEQLALVDEVVARAAAIWGSAAKTLASLPADVVHGLSGSLAPTAQSGEHPPPDSLDGVDNVVHDVPGRYEFTTGPQGAVEELGRGGIGRVVVATDHFVGREVAMKQLLTEHVANPQLDTRVSVALEARFLREARVTAQLEHPAIVPVHELGRRRDGSPYYTMRRIQGRTLHSATRAASLQERLRLMPSVLSVCQAIAYAHSRGVIHRDVKPQNVMLGSFGETYVLDWGLARLKGKRDERARDLRLAPDITGGVNAGAVGTPSYMSPEQAEGRVDDIDERSDVWGLGALLFEVLTGRPPFAGSNAFEVMAEILSEPVPAVRSLTPDAPAELAAVCERALQKDPARRYQTSAELLRDVDAWVNGRRVSAYAYSPLELLGRFVRRYAVAVAVAGVALVALAGLGVASWLRIVDERNESRQFAQLLLGDVLDRVTPIAGSRELVEQLTRRAAEFYARLGGEAMTPLETERLMRAWRRLGVLNRNLARTDDARASYGTCLALAGRVKAAEQSASVAALKLDCLVGQGDLLLLGGTPEAAMPSYQAAEQFVRELAGRWDADPAWMSSEAVLYARFGRVLLQSGDPNKAWPAYQRSLDLEERVMAVMPERIDASRNHADSLRDAALAFFNPADPKRGLELGARAIVIARRVQAEGDVRAMVSLGSALRQQAMFLGWTQEPRQAEPLVVEGRHVFEKALALEPADVAALGEYADLLLEAGEPERSLQLLTRADAQGVRGEWESSLVLSALLAGRTAEVLRRADALTRAGDAQARLVVALALAADGRPREAAELLAANAGPVGTEALQWPKDGVLRWAGGVRSAASPALQRFAADFQQAFIADDEAGRRAAVDALVAALRELPGRK